MAGIKEPEAIKFVNEVVRPMAERARKFNLLVDQLGLVDGKDALASWSEGKSALFSNDATLVEDGREAEAINKVSGADVHNFMDALAQIRALTEVVAKPCVRDEDANVPGLEDPIP